MSTLSNVATRGGEANPPSVRVAPETIPEAKSSQTGVSVKYVPTPDKIWFVFRASYGREDKASDYIVEDGTSVYIAKRYARKSVNGKQKKVQETLIPNHLFVYTTEDKAKEYVKDTPALSYLTFYYNHFELDDDQKNPPLTDTLLNDEGVQHYIEGIRLFSKTVENTTEYIKCMLDAYNHGRGFLWKIMCHENPIGLVNVMDFDENPSLCYALNISYRGRGLMYEALISILSFLSGIEKKCIDVI